MEKSLINEVKKHRELYNKASNGYKNVLLKNKIWTNIALKLDFPGASIF